MKKTCDICKQKIDFYTNIHKKEPFINGKNYDCVCFTCFFTPRTMEQTYEKDGCLKDEISLPYCCENIKTAKELYSEGASESLAYAKNCVEAIQKLCVGKKAPKKPLNMPKTSWNLC